MRRLPSFTMHRFALVCVAVDALTGHPHLETKLSEYASMQFIQLCNPKEFISWGQGDREDRIIQGADESSPCLTTKTYKSNKGSQYLLTCTALFR